MRIFPQSDLFSVLFEHQLYFVLPNALLALLQFDHPGPLKQGKVSDLPLDALLSLEFELPEELKCLFGQEQLEESELFLEEVVVDVLLFDLPVLGFIFGQLRQLSLQIHNVDRFLRAKFVCLEVLFLFLQGEIKPFLEDALNRLQSLLILLHFPLFCGELIKMLTIISDLLCHFKVVSLLYFQQSQSLLQISILLFILMPQNLQLFLQLSTKVLSLETRTIDLLTILSNQGILLTHPHQLSPQMTRPFLLTPPAPSFRHYPPHLGYLIIYLTVALIFLESLQEVEQTLFVQLFVKCAFVYLIQGGDTSITERCFSRSMDYAINARSVSSSFYWAWLYARLREANCSSRPKGADRREVICLSNSSRYFSSSACRGKYSFVLGLEGRMAAFKQ